VTDFRHLVLRDWELGVIVQGLVEISFAFPPMEKEILALAKKLGQEKEFIAARNFRLERRRLQEESLRRKA
jgi:hypothetical protein